jgi:ribonuclease/clavin/mitogillin
MQVTDHIYSIPADQIFFTGPQTPNVFLVHDGGEGAFIDSGFGDEKSLQIRLDFLKEHPDIRLTNIVLTHHHFDHTSGAPKFREETGAKIVLHADEEDFLIHPRADAPEDIEVPEEMKELAAQVKELRETAAKAVPDVLVRDSDVVKVGGLNLEIVHTPGHTLGSMCIYLREERAIFTGDTAIGLGTVAISPPPYGDMGLYIESLRRLQTYDCALMCPGHGVTVHDVGAKFQELIDHRFEREAQVLRLLKDGKRTPKAMLSVIYMELDKRILPSALRQIEAHLCKLEKDGQVKREGEEWAAV